MTNRSGLAEFKVEAAERDSCDDLAPFRQRFVIENPDLIYVDGNSLGRLPTATAGRLEKLINIQWGKRLIRSWNEGWFELPERIGAKLSSLIGAREDEVILADSTSVNLFKLALAALRIQSNRTTVVTDDLNFPSDLYILQGVVDLAGPEYRLEVVSSPDGVYADVDGLRKAIDKDTALVALSHTAFKSGYTYNMPSITEMAHGAGALVLWDTSHSVGAMPVELNNSGADLAVGCGYKYLSGGPGAPAFLYARGDLQDRIANPISGWMGHQEPFEFALTYRPTAGLRSFLSGTPPILSLAAAEAGIDLLLEAGIDRVREKSIRQSEYFIELWNKNLSHLGFHLRSPRQASQRGSHVTLGHVEGRRISQALIEEMKVIPDFRRPDNIRFGFAPLYNSFSDVYRVAESLVEVVSQRLYEKYEGETLLVT